MESIYNQMNKIDDKESLNEKYNVRTFRDIERLHEALTPENNDLQLIKSKWDDGQDDYGDIGDLRILQTIRKYYTPEDIECWYWRKDHSGDRPCYLVIETADGDEISFEENNGSLYQLDESLTEANEHKTYRYPKGSPITRFDKDAGNTTEDFETVAVSLAKAKNNIVYKIKQKYNLTGVVTIDPSKILVIDGNGGSGNTSQTGTPQPAKQEEPEQLTLNI